MSDTIWPLGYVASVEVENPFNALDDEGTWQKPKTQTKGTKMQRVNPKKLETRHEGISGSRGAR